MNEYLYRQELDDSTFPDRSFRAGTRGINAELLGEAEGKRIKAPHNALHLLLVVFRLDETADPGVVWRLDIESMGKDGKPRTLSIALLEPPSEGERFKLPPDLIIPPGMIYRGAFWVDLSNLFPSVIVLPGDQLHIRYGNQSTTVQIPTAQ